jgi:hypothetical protein
MMGSKNNERGRLRPLPTPDRTVREDNRIVRDEQQRPAREDGKIVFSDQRRGTPRPVKKELPPEQAPRAARPVQETEVRDESEARMKHFFNDIARETESAPASGPAPSALPPPPEPAFNDNNAGATAAARRRRSMVFPVALVLTVAYAAGIAALWYFGQEEIAPLRASINSVGLAAVAAVAVLPVIVIWAVALAVHRSRQMHMLTASMAALKPPPANQRQTKAPLPSDMAQRPAAARQQSALQVQSERLLAEFDGTSLEKFNRAAVQEVAAINEGIERAMRRASELRALVQQEVSTLEHAYFESETRIRTLANTLKDLRRVGFDDGPTKERA